MPRPQLGGGEAFDLPPEDLLNLSPQVRQYFLMLHHRLFGLPGVGQGDLDEINVANALRATTATTADSANTASHANLTGVTAYQHHGAGNHQALDRGSAVTNGVASAVSVTSANASDLATAITLANEL